jgi:hypothetical protein
MFAHYLRLVQMPGWSDYVHHQVTSMAAQHPELYAAFPAKLRQELKRIALAQVSDPSQPSPK